MDYRWGLIDEVMHILKFAISDRNDCQNVEDENKFENKR